MAVVVRDLYFNYDKYDGKKCVLNGVSICVEKGTIYGLLGPSGCGKTTLLKAIIGLCKPAAGQVLVFGFEPGTSESGVPGSGVGYMPQELALQTDLKIGEIFNYFARIHCMERYQLKGIIKFLLKTFDLPDESRLLSTLSGGQKRRMSLALALLHKPRLLILDEPTVGVDPILSEVIWKLMFTLSTMHQTTIIITTHYIDEAKRANSVAFMRKGQILQENNPQTLMKKYCANTLEEVFLQFCVKQKQKQTSNEVCVKQNSHNFNHCRYANVCEKEPYVNQECNHFKRFFNVLIAIIAKYVTETRRNPFAILLLFAMTVFTMICVVFVVGETPKHLKIAWVVDEPFFESRTIEPLTLSDSLEYENENETMHYSQTIDAVYLPDLLKASIRSEIIALIYYSNISEAHQDAKRKLIHGAIHLGANFSNAFLDCDVLLNLGDDCLHTHQVEEAKITLFLDLTSPVIANTIRFSIQDSLLRFRRKIAAYFHLNQDLVIPLVNVDPIFGEFSDDDFFGAKAFIAPGFMIFISYGFSVTLSSLSLLTDPNNDMFVRTLASGVQPLQSLLGQVIALFSFLSIASFLNFFGTSYFLNISCEGSISLVVALFSIQTLLGIIHGILFSSLFDNSTISLFTCVGFLYNMLFTTGVMWTIYAQPYFMRWTSYALPLFHAANALREIMNKDNAPLHPFIWPAFAVTIAWIVILFTASVFILKKRKY